jgi:glyoxylase-like metal-dependent hydrolase (beta-lactamase superfamily II)
VTDVKVVPVPIKMGPMTVMAYLLVGDRVVIVDTGIAGQTQRILDAVTTAGRSAADVSLILLTHGHGDHAGSAIALRDATGAPVALGAGDEEKCVSGVDTEMRARHPLNKTLLVAIRRRHALTSSPVGPVPDIVIDGERSLLEFGVDAVVVPTPGHSRGSLSVFTAAGDALVGDLMGGRGREPRTVRRGGFVCDEDAMSTSIRYVIAQGPERVYTGHDEKPFTLEQLTSAVGLL